MELSGFTYMSKRQNKSKKVISAVIIIFIIIVTAVLGFSIGSVFSLIYPEKLPVEVFSTNIVPVYEDISLIVKEDSIILKGWRFYKKENTKVVILSHDYGSNRLQFGIQTIDLVKKLINSEYDVILFDYRNHGYSDGKVTSLGFIETRDLETIVNYSKDREYTEINIIGFGMGANIALELMESRDDINSVIADTPSNSFEQFSKFYIDKTKINRIFPFNKLVPYMIKLFTGAGKLESDHFNNIDKIMPGKIMFIHGGEDSFIDKSISKKYFTKITEKYPYNARYLEFEGAEYLESFIIDPTKYTDAIVEFLSE